MMPHCVYRRGRSQCPAGELNPLQTAWVVHVNQSQTVRLPRTRGERLRWVERGWLK